MQDVLLKINGRGILWQSFDDIQELLIDLPGTAEITFGRPKAPWHAMAMAHQWEVGGSCCCCFWLRSPSLAIGEKGRFWVPTTKARLINYDQLMFYWAGGFAFLIGIILTYFSGPFYQSSSCLRFIRLYRLSIRVNVMFPSFVWSLFLCSVKLSEALNRICPPSWWYTS